MTILPPRQEIFQVMPINEGQREGLEGLRETGSQVGAWCDFYVTSMLGVLCGDRLLSRGKAAEGADRRLKQ